MFHSSTKRAHVFLGGEGGFGVHCCEIKLKVIYKDRKHNIFICSSERGARVISMQKIFPLVSLICATLIITGSDISCSLCDSPYGK